jgi:hypothetical protein
MDTRSLDELRADLVAHAEALQATAAQLEQSYHERLSSLPSPDTTAAGLLLELASAEEDCQGHFHRSFPALDHQHAACGAEEDARCARCRDWSRCCRRRDAAVRALTEYATALRDAGKLMAVTPLTSERHVARGI